MLVSVKTSGPRIDRSTWLSAASRDKRIKAIVPMVIDTLNLPVQAKHQLEAYGKLSEQVIDYSAAGITQITTQLATDKLWAWGCLWNANGGGGANSSVLSGDRLSTFKKILAAW